VPENKFPNLKISEQPVFDVYLGKTKEICLESFRYSNRIKKRWDSIKKITYKVSIKNSASIFLENGLVIIGWRESKEKKNLIQKINITSLDSKNDSIQLFFNQSVLLDFKSNSTKKENIKLNLNIEEIYYTKDGKKHLPINESFCCKFSLHPYELNKDFFNLKTYIKDGIEYPDEALTKVIYKNIGGFYIESIKDNLSFVANANTEIVIFSKIKEKNINIIIESTDYKKQNKGKYNILLKQKNLISKNKLNYKLKLACGKEKNCLHQPIINSSSKVIIIISLSIDGVELFKRNLSVNFITSQKDPFLLLNVSNHYDRTYINKKISLSENNIKPITDIKTITTKNIIYVNDEYLPKTSIFKGCLQYLGKINKKTKILFSIEIISRTSSLCFLIDIQNNKEINNFVLDENCQVVNFELLLDEKNKATSKETDLKNKVKFLLKVVYIVENTKKEIEIVNLNLESSYEILPRAPDRFLCIDLGTSSTAVAISDETDNKFSSPEPVDLASVVEMHDPNHEEKGKKFISSSISLNPNNIWRNKIHGCSLWAYMDSNMPFSSGKIITKQLKRDYAISFPFRQSDEIKDKSDNLISAPKILMMLPKNEINKENTWQYHDGIYQIKDTINIEKLTSNILHEIADFYLPWATYNGKIFQSRLILTHPNQYSKLHKNRLKNATKLISERIGSVPHSTRLVSESDAVAAYFLQKNNINNKIIKNKSGGKLNILVFDLGAGTLDLTLTKTPVDKDGNLNFSPSNIKKRMGVALGGDMIDLVLYFMIDSILSAFSRQEEIINYINPLTEEVSSNLKTTNSARHLKSKYNLAASIRKAKIKLSNTCRKNNISSNTLFWENEEKLLVKIGSFNDRKNWPIDIIEKVEGDIELDSKKYENINIKIKKSDIYLSLTKTIVKYPDMNTLIDFMVREVPHIFFKGEKSIKLKNIDILLLSGRASLWPLVHEGLDTEIKKSGNDWSFSELLIYEKLPDASELKQAVAEGAINIARNVDLPPKKLEHDAFYILCWIPSDSGPNYRKLKQLTKEREVIKIHDKVSLIQAPSGLELSDIKKPWMSSLLFETEHPHNAIDLNSRDHKITVILETDEEGKKFYRLGDFQGEVKGKCFPIIPTLRNENCNINKKHCPPGYPKSVELQNE